MLMCSVDEVMNDPLMFEVVHNDMFSINNMSDEEVRTSIIHDILMVTMIEKEEKVTLDFDQQQLFRWIKPTQHGYVYNQLCHQEVSGLIENKNGQLRIKDQREILQAAMDYCGHWYNGFEPPEGEEGVIRFNPEGFKEQVEAAGGFNQFCQNVYDKIAPELMDLEATVPGSKTLN